MDVWNTNDLDQVMVNVFDKLKVIFCNILRGNGGNDLVEKYGGKEGKKVKIEKKLNEMNANDDDNKVIDLNDHDEFIDDDGNTQVQFI